MPNAASFVLALGLLAITPAAADDIMVVKAGEWVRTTAMDGGSAGNPIKSCASKDRTMTDAVLEKMMHGQKCQFSHSKSGSVVTINSVCDLGASKINTVVTMTLVSADEYTMSSKSHIDNPPKGMSSDMSMDMHWVHTGPCQLGDRMMPGQTP